MIELYENIKKYRLERNMSQAELAEKAGYTDRSSIAKIEHGDVDLQRSKIMAIAKALGVPAGELMGNAGVCQQHLRKDESDLLRDYNLLTENARKMVLEHVGYLKSKPEYQKKKGESFDSTG